MSWNGMVTSVHCPKCGKYAGKPTAWFNGLDELVKVEFTCKKHGTQELGWGHCDMCDVFHDWDTWRLPETLLNQDADGGDNPPMSPDLTNKEN